MNSNLRMTQFRLPLGLALGLMVVGAALPGMVRAADDAPARVAGNWLTEPKDGIIQIAVRADGVLEARIVGGNHPGRKDEKNPDATLRGLALRGQLIVRDMKYEGAGHWSGGTIYDPDSGKTYKCNLDLSAPDTVRVRGYIGFSLLGRSQEWTRYTGTSMDLPPAR
jgi:uncharacterized protein (DUF2147 family)